MRNRIVSVDIREGNISPFYEYNKASASIARELLVRAETPDAIKHFARHCNDLTDYDYWFLLSTLWVSYSGNVDLALWKRLLSSDRPNREQCVMKPNEYRAYKALRDVETVYRTHRADETDWISYTTSLKAAKRFQRSREGSRIQKYTVAKQDVFALFLRRGEDEIIVLDKGKVCGKEVAEK